MASNLPPGVTDSMIPGNRPEDREVEIVLVLSISEIEDLKKYNEEQQKIDIKKRDNFSFTIENIIEQLDEQ